jgi:hypothetical protein
VKAWDETKRITVFMCCEMAERTTETAKGYREERDMITLQFEGSKYIF